MITRDAAFDLLKKYNKDPFHIQHALTVEGVMAWYAKELGYGEEAHFWGMAGLLHDVDFEMYPEEHCVKAPELLAEIDASSEMVHAICSHAYGSCSDVEPVHQMEKVLFAVDELTGLIGAAARMRPSKSCMDMEVSSLKKKFKDKKFAAGCSREVIRQGADILGWPLASLYAVYYVVRKRSLYAGNLTPGKALKAIFRGILDNRVTRQARGNPRP